MQPLGFYCPHTDLIALLPFSFTVTQEPPFCAKCWPPLYCSPDAPLYCCTAHHVNPLCHTTAAQELSLLRDFDKREVVLVQKRQVKLDDRRDVADKIGEWGSKEEGGKEEVCVGGRGEGGQPPFPRGPA